MAGPQIAGVLVDQCNLRLPKAVRAEGPWFEINHCAPLADQARILARADMFTTSRPTGEKPIVRLVTSSREPGGQCVAGRIGDFERDRPAGLLLDHCGALAQDATGRDIADPQLDEVAATKLRINTQLNRARSRTRLLDFSCWRMPQMCLGLSGGLAPTIRPRFHERLDGRKRSNWAMTRLRRLASPSYAQQEIWAWTTQPESRPGRGPRRGGLLLLSSTVLVASVRVSWPNAVGLTGDGGGHAN